jgi:hypothetical protein
VLVVGYRPVLQLPHHPSSSSRASSSIDTNVTMCWGGVVNDAVGSLEATVPAITSEAIHWRLRTVTSWPGAGAPALSPSTRSGMLQNPTAGERPESR